MHMFYRFVDEFLPKANPTYSLIYLYALRFASQNKKIPTMPQMAENLRLMPSDVNSAWLFWTTFGLASIDGDEISLTTLPQTKATNTSDEIWTWLCSEFSEIFGGTMSSKDMQTLMYLYNDLAIDAYVIHLIASYAKTQGKISMSFIEKIARDWHSKEIDSVEKAEKLLKNIEQGKKIVKNKKEFKPVEPKIKEIGEMSMEDKMLIKLLNKE